MFYNGDVGSEGLPGWFAHLSAHLGIVKKTEQEIWNYGSTKVPHGAHSKEGGGGWGVNSFLGNFKKRLLFSGEKKKTLSKKAHCFSFGKYLVRFMSVVIYPTILFGSATFQHPENRV